ncbi:hypothetical protein [Methylobacterium oryzisoli]|uniref:hypothetical protein n=1 Tax=Methylobacterium oryzisoli TaxID=3385502 RepID=UPI003892AE86
MVADTVEIVTVSPDEDEARKISLRSVHGVFLIKLLDKATDPEARALGPHGTSFKLTFRRSAKPIDVLATVKQWVRFPRCKVSVIIDDQPVENVGFKSPKEALEAYIENSTTQIFDKDKVKIVEKSINGVSLAFALQHSSHFRDWSFLPAPENTRRNRRLQLENSPVATCVEGIAVEFDTPGYVGGTILSIANIVGHDAPRTNVARSLVEATTEKENAIRHVYRMLFESVAEESIRLRNEEGFSLTWSVEQIPFLLGPIAASARIPIQYRIAHQDAFSAVPMFVVETEEGRSAKSLADLKALDEFWSVDSQLMRSVENFVREARSEVTAKALLVTSQGTSAAIPNGALLANSHRADLVQAAFQSDFEPVEIVGNLSDRRLDMKWQVARDRWIYQDAIVGELYDSGLHDILRYFQEHERDRKQNVMSAKSIVKSINLDEYAAVRADYKLYLLPGTPLAHLIENPAATSIIDKLFEQFVYMNSLPYISRGFSAPDFNAGEAVERYYRTLASQPIVRYLPNIEPLRNSITQMAGRLRIFDPLSWSQRDDIINRFA